MFMKYLSNDPPGETQMPFEIRHSYVYTIDNLPKIIIVQLKNYFLFEFYPIKDIYKDVYYQFKLEIFERIRNNYL